MAGLGTGGRPTAGAEVGGRLARSGLNPILGWLGVWNGDEMGLVPVVWMMPPTFPAEENSDLGRRLFEPPGSLPATTA